MNLQQEIEETQLALGKLKAKYEQQQISTGRAYSKDEVNFTVASVGHIFKDKDCNYIPIGRAFKDKATAERLVRYEKLQHEARLAMKESWGDVVVGWDDSNQSKACIIWIDNDTYIDIWKTNFKSLHFKTTLDAVKFKDKYSYEDMKLLIMGIPF